MIVIHKKTVKMSDRAVSLPLGARPLSIGMQHGEITLWFSRDLGVVEEFDLRLLLLPTGQSSDLSPDHYIPLGRLDTEGDGTFILHAFYDKRSLR